MKSSLEPAQRLRREVDAWALRLGVCPRVVRIQRMTAKWGSCSSAGIVCFSDDLVDQSRDFRDYVVVHELLHLRIPSHGRLFKTLMSLHVPGWRDLERDAGRTL